VKIGANWFVYAMKGCQICYSNRFVVKVAISLKNIGVIYETPKSYALFVVLAVANRAVEYISGLVYNLVN